MEPRWAFISPKNFPRLIVMGNSFVLFGVSMEIFPWQFWEIGHKKKVDSPWATAICQCRVKSVM